MTIGALDKDSGALAKRLELQHRLSTFRLNDWIFQHIDPKPGERWLDLGCGRGEQSLPLAKIVESVTSVDLSEESLAALRAADDTDRIETVHVGLDDIEKLTTRSGFSGVVGSYSLYYANDPVALFRNISSALNDGGRLFFCGPAYENNIEIRSLSAIATSGSGLLTPTKPSQFMEDTALVICSSLFGSVEVFRFENHVRFTSVRDLVDYWTSHNLFRPDALDRFTALAKEHFERSDQFVNVKRGIGVLASGLLAHSPIL
jgi:SAM-dependent methyltransferase